MGEFYDELATWYHLIYADWDKSIAIQGEQLASIIKKNWKDVYSILDVSCGIGTQSLALSSKGYHVTGSDLSINAIQRASEEAKKRALDITFSVCDMKHAAAHHKKTFDVVISADNSLPHLLSDHELKVALEQMYCCTKVGGGCLITIRDYAKEKKGINLLHSYGVRMLEGKRIVIFQVWDFEGEIYDLTFYFVVEDFSNSKIDTHAMRTRYYAVPISKIMQFMEEVGFANVSRLDEGFFQPVLMGTK